MKIHLVGGYSGSGKTTAINNACKILKDKNITTSILKDDQVAYVVDNRPAQKFGIPFAKVTGGCSCCNYNQLDFQINLLKKASDPSVIFAEYSGTCSNLIESLLNPLRDRKDAEIELANFSTFADANLLLMYTQGPDMPLSVENKYIWEKHIHESEILVVTKIDLLADNELETLKSLIKNRFPLKTVIYQNSLNEDSIENWIEIISKPQLNQNEINVAGESVLALLDEEIEFITTDHSAVQLACDFMSKLADDIVQKMLPIEHLQYYLSFNGKSTKLSYATLPDKNIPGSITSEKSNSVDLLINARVHTTPEELRKILFELLKQFKSLEGVTLREKFISYFQP